MPAENDFRRLMREHLRATRAGKFGQFEFSLTNKQPLGEGFVGRNDTELFFFTIVPTVVGDFTVAATDFTSELSENPPGNTPSFAAAKFVKGPNGDSAFGATQTQPVPGPFEGQITLSEQSSGSTPAADLGGAISFDVNFIDGNSGPQQLLLAITNNTPLATPFDISEIYWNVTDKVKALENFQPVGVSGWGFISNV